MFWHDDCELFMVLWVLMTMIKVEMGIPLLTIFNDPTLFCAGGASFTDDAERVWARRCACDAASAAELRDAVVNSHVESQESKGWTLSTDAKGITVLHREEPSTPILSIAAHFDVMAQVIR
jgi:hypothetical protein